MLILTVRGSTLVSESDVYRRQILSAKVDPHSVRVKQMTCFSTIYGDGISDIYKYHYVCSGPQQVVKMEQPSEKPVETKNSDVKIDVPQKPPQDEVKVEGKPEEKSK